MKKILLSVILSTSLVLPWACSDNATPSQPSGPPLGGGAPTNTPTGTVTPASATNTFTPAAGTFTNTPSPTPAVAVPPYVTEWAAASSPNGFYLAGGQLFVAEGDSFLSELEAFNTGSGVITPIGNLINGAILLNHPVGMCFTPANNSYFVVLDQTASNGASIYTGSTPPLDDINTGTSWGTQAFSKPNCLATDGYYVYIADTGNGFIEEFDPNGTPSPIPIHRWGGFFSTLTSSAVAFKQPVAVAISPSGNIVVADNGSTPPTISAFASNGTLWVGTQFNAIGGCVVNGMAVTVDALNNDLIYISDSAHNQVQEYDHTGVLLRSWTENNGPSQYLPFKPGPIAIDAANNHILVGDQANATIEVFGP